MEFILNEVETRVLGALLEKELATPEYYPLSLNALVNACNQKNNRDPVVSYEEKTVARALESLRERQLVLASGAGRVPKYEENLTRPRNLLKAEAAALGVLMLRGPQTAGEIKSRADRMHKFESLAEVEETFKVLEDIGWARKLPRQPGQKEARFAHLLMGGDKIPQEEFAAKTEPVILEVRAENDRTAKLEEDLASLGRELEELKQAFLDFKKQFE